MLDHLEQQYGQLFSSVFKSITFDNGPEFSTVDEIEGNGRLTAYYAHPYSSFERGTSENWNGIVRRFIPKGRSLADLEAETLTRINRFINQLPRRRFNYRTPEELFEEKLKDIIKSASTPKRCSACCT